jgi:hypothetical protein
MRILLFLILFPFYSISQIDANYLIGNWIVFATPNYKLEDCNDEIRFKANGEYFIYNDCFGEIENSLIESGRWELSKNKRLFLKERRILTNLPSFDTSANVNFEVKYLKPKHYELFSWGFGSFFLQKKKDKKSEVHRLESFGNFDTLIFPIEKCTRIKIGYMFYNDADIIEVGNKSTLGYKKIGPKKNIKEEFIEVLVDYRFGFPLKVISENPKSKWQIKIYYIFDP